MKATVHRIVRRRNGEVLIIRTGVSRSAAGRRRRIKSLFLLDYAAVDWVRLHALEPGRPEDIDYLMALFLGLARFIGTE